MSLVHNELMAHRHFYIVVVIVIVAGLVFASIISSYFTTHQKISTHYQQIFEKKTLSELAIFHQSNQEKVDSYLAQNLAVVTALSINGEIVGALQANDTVKVKSIFDRQRQINQYFNSIGVLDEKGTFLLVSSEDDLAKFIGQDFSARPYFQKVTTDKGPVITTIFGTIAGRDALIFSAPVIDSASGEITHVINGTVFFTDLTNKLNITPYLDEFEFIITDQAGKIIIHSQNKGERGLDISQKDRVVERLIAGDAPITEEEINWYNQRVFAQGSVINLGDNKILFVSSYNKNQFDDELGALEEVLQARYFHLLVRVVALSLGGLLLIGWILKRHDTSAHHP